MDVLVCVKHVPETTEAEIVVDESGEDYLYPASYFISIKVPHKVEESLLHIS